MGRVTDPTSRIMASAPKSVQAGGPHTASMDIDLSGKVIRLWYESNRKVHAWNYPCPDDAPYAGITAIDTAYDFAIATPTSSDSVVWPWVIGPDFDAVLVEFVVGLPAGVAASNVSVNAYTETLLSAVATTTGAAYGLSGYETAQRRDLWGYPDQPLQPAIGFCALEDPALAASGGLVGLGLQITWSPGYQPASGDLATPVAKLISASAWNAKRSPM